MNRRQFLAALACVCTLGFASAARADFAGPVIAILDGDTIDVLIDRQPVRVRLAQIDAPEKRQAFGTRSRQALSALVFRQSVTVADAGRDRYGRVLGTVYVFGVNVNAEMVRQGMAWVYRQYATDRSLFALEDEARAGRRGLWADPSPVPPWQFRRQ
ncbi:thermonuclease family protein [Xanthomonas campestris]|uniref:thermonuclease family protein n=1 Tax=Xanthomonas campestris TaxID=339 RepID=UPI0008A121F7|nr:thermonuclease family protein [Xanthomonas campestris]